MSELQEREDPAAIEPSPAPSQSVPKPGFHDDDLEAHLREFEAATASPGAEAEPETTFASLADMPELPADPNTVAAIRASMEGIVAERARLAEYEQHLEAREEFEDFKGLIATVREELPEANLKMSEDMIVSWLLMLHRADEKVGRDWDNRKANPEQWRARVGYVLGKLHEELRSLPDREATEDAQAVAHFMRSGQSAPQRPAMPHNINRMSNADYKRHLKEAYGYDSRLE